jgi:mono/diheme cytochrome c family protein
MARPNRFFLVSGFVVATAFLAFLAFSNSQPTSVFAATAAATQASKGGAASLPQGNVERGKYLVEIGACADCHGARQLAAEGQEPPLAGGVEFPLGPLGTYYSANLTKLQNWTTEDFFKVLHQGVDPESGRVLAPVMPYMNYAGMSDEDVASIGAYLKTLTPVENNVPEAKPGPAAKVALHPLPGTSVPAVKASTTAAYGKYIVHNVSSCIDCHSPRNPVTQQYIQGRDLAGGGLNLGTDEEPLYASPIIGSVLTAEGYTKDNFIATIRTGVRPWGALLPVQMPWIHFRNMTDNDLTAVWNYLETLKNPGPWPVQKPAATQEGGQGGPGGQPGPATPRATASATQGK